jgi:hypothetical protein
MNIGMAKKAPRQETDAVVQWMMGTLIEIAWPFPPHSGVLLYNANMTSKGTVAA